MDCEKVKLPAKAEDSLKAKEEAATDIDIDIVEQMVSETTAILTQLTNENFDSLAGKFVNLPFEDNEERIGSVYIVHANTKGRNTPTYISSVKFSQRTFSLDEFTDEILQCEWGMHTELKCLAQHNLTQVVRVLVEKAINEPINELSSISIYARLIPEIWKNSKEYPVTFREKIMDECRKQFQKSRTDKTEIKEIAIKKTNDESIKEQEIEEKRAQMERRTRGIVNFIGELYTLRTQNQKLLPACFMVEVVDMLLSSFDELNLECLCKLLTTVGFKLEKHLRGVVNAVKRKKGEGQEITFGPEWFDKTFKKLSEWSKEESLSSGVRFALLDVLELRQTNWKSRGDVKTPETDLKKVELHKAKNPWKSRRGSADDNINKPIVRQTSADNLDTLVEQFQSLPLEDNDERISSVIRTIFEKSIDEPTKCAKMVHTICQNSQETSKIFRKKILDQCQTKFQKTSTDETDIKEIEIAIEKSDDVSKKESLKKEVEEKRTQMKRQSLGNVNFMGELYKLQMLSPRTMIDCITMLLSMNELNLECLCKLLTTVGLKLEEQIKDVEISNELKRSGGQEIKFAPEPKWFDKTFKKLNDLNKEVSLSPRIRFALLDVYELRQNNWKPRHNANAPETSDEVCRDAIRGDIKKASDWNTVPSNKSSKFQQKQSGDQSVSGPGSQSLFKGSQKSWGSTPSPSPIPQLQMQSQTEKLPSQPTLPPRYGGSRFDA